ncbi:patatin-like phospholipase family protein [Telmatospirillum sp. J64-1]|uniref:patatin-like phospholipase family protein n=1 Tax=Telmatospirillum sp. J64-1 TaxID=2502183 RepID=UPI00163D8394|nr:patatin-like phospholipase family protein [Telmatospirillum sp. J64-1]
MKRKRIALAVQGGGSHGAFTWGVLDRLLDEVAADRLEIAAVSGASAGAFNATLTAYGLGSEKGRAQKDLAKNTQQLLESFWLSDAALAPVSPYSLTALAWRFATGSWNIDSSPIALAIDTAGQWASPSDLPAGPDWLALVLGDKVDFERLQRQKGPALFISATNITQGRRDVFARDKVTLDVLRASACIPTVFRPIQIGDSHYWDGGFMGNPALSPLIGHADDMLVIQLNPFHDPQTPTGARAIADRLNEITFNTSLVLELNAIQAMNKAIEAAKQESLGRYRPVRLHRITDEPFLAQLGVVSKLVIVEPFLRDLHDQGWQVADQWLQNEGAEIGRSSTLGDEVLDRIIGRDNVLGDSSPARPAPAPAALEAEAV